MPSEPLKLDAEAMRLLQEIATHLAAISRDLSAIVHEGAPVRCEPAPG